jgi:response regulator RpfG family c-di-GMP phosphodiesterase
MFPKKNYDIVFMDLLMPEMDGFEATQKIRDMEGLAEHLPIIALTANVSDEDRDLCFKAGMNEILPKPVRLAELSNCLDRWLPETLRLTPHSSSTEVVAVGSDHSRSSQRQEILSPQIEQVQDLKQSQDIEQHQGVEELDVQYGTDAQNDVMDLKPFAIFDFDSVLKITGGRDDIAQKVIQAFLSNVSNNFDALRKTIEEKHVSNCRREAHTLKSSAAYAGHIRLSELSKALEAKCCGDQFPDQATDFLISMRRAHEAFLKELKSSKPDWV